MSLTEAQRHQLLVAFDEFLVTQSIGADDFLLEWGADMTDAAEKEQDPILRSLYKAIGEHLNTAGFDLYVSTK